MFAAQTQYHLPGPARLVLGAIASHKLTLMPSIMLKYQAHRQLQPQSLSPVGRCKTFDASGDGYGRAEGVATAVLALPAADILPLAVVRGSAVNQDGRSGTLTAPNGPSQSSLVAKAMRSGT